MNDTTNSTAVFSGRGESGRIADRLGDTLSGRKILVVTDREVGALHLEAFLRPLIDAGAQCTAVAMEMTGSAKSVDTVKHLIAQLTDNDFSQSDKIIGLGGGNVQDVAAFCASVYRGGLSLTAVPTSLYAMIALCESDRAYLNFSGYKDMLSVPVTVGVRMIDPLFLKTLPQRQYANGMAEALRIACLADARLLDRLQQGELSDDQMAELVLDAGTAAQNIPAAFSRFGSQLGSVIEEHFRFMKYTHGEAVGLGMLAVTGDPIIADYMEKSGLPIFVEGVGRETLLRKWIKTFFPPDTDHEQVELVTVDPPGQPSLLTVRREEAEVWFTDAVERIYEPA